MIKNIYKTSVTSLQKVRLGLTFGLAILAGHANAQLTGIKSIPGDYSTISAAVADLNTQGVGLGGVTFNISAGYTETISAPISLTATGTASDQIIFQKSGIGANPVITAFVGTKAANAAIQDGIWNFVGSDYVSIFNIDLFDPNSTNPATMEYGFAFYKASATDGCQNNTIQGCYITLSRVNNASGGGPSVEGSKGINLVNALASTQTTTLTVTSADGSHSFNKFYNNTIENVNYGIAIIGYAGTSPFAFSDYGNQIGGSSSTGNTIINYGGGGTTNPAAAIRTLAQYDMIVTYNIINNNTGTGVNHGTTLRGIYINTATSANVDITFNTITLNGGATTSTITAIENSAGSTAAGNTININNNLIQNSTYTTATSGDFNGILNGGTPATLNINENTIKDNVLPGTGTFTGINAASSSGNLIFMNNNTVINNTKTGASGTLYALRASTALVTANSNIIDNNGVSTSATSSTSGNAYGYYNSGSPTSETYTNNSITNLYVSNATTSNISTVAGIYMNTSSSSDKVISGNQINSLSINNAAAGTVKVYGIYQSLGDDVNIFSNKIYNLSVSGAGSSVSGIYLNSGTTFNVYNNIIGDLKSPAASGANPNVGIFINGGTNANLYYNTIHMNASSSGTDFGSSALFASTTPTLDLRNNILINASTANGTGLTAAYRRSSTSLSTYASASNNNIFYAGTPSASNVIFYDGTDSYETLSGYQTLVSPRDVDSKTENVLFSSYSGPSSLFLHVDPTVASYAESGGQPISMITVDYDGDTRNATTPDIGADEFSGIMALPPVINSLTISPTGSACVATSRTVTANITPVAPLVSVTLNYSFDGVAQTPVTMTGGSTTATSNWTATIPVAVPANAIVDWSVTASDGALSETSIGTSYGDAPLTGLTILTNTSASSICAGSSTSITSMVTNPANQTAPSGYCASNATTPASDEDIGQVIFGSLINGSATPVVSNATAVNGYTDFTSLTPVNVPTGQSMPLSVSIINSDADVYNTVVSVYIDLNRNGSFESSENLYNASVPNDPLQRTALGNITVPNGSDLGLTRMRIIARETTTSPVLPCITYTWGETEDYLVNIIAGGFTYSWSDGSTTVATTPDISVSPTVTTNYTLTATDVNGCSLVSAPVTITVNPIPSTPTATNSSQCGEAVPTASVTSTSGETSPMFNWYTVSTGGTPLAGESGNTLSAYVVSSTQTFYVSELVNGCESPRVAVTVTVSTPPVITVSLDEAICAGESATISASSANTGYTYTWTPGNMIGASHTVTPTSTTTYNVVAEDNSGGANDGCATSGSVTVTVNPLPSAVTASASVSTVCGSGVVNLTSSATSPLNVLMGENFENPSVNFTLTGTGINATDNSTYYAEGSTSGHITYSANANGNVEMINSIDLTGTTNPKMSFKQIAATESGYDYAYVQYSTDNGATWTSFPTSSYLGTGTLKNGVVSFDESSYTDWNSQFTSSSATPGTGPATALWKQETIDLTAYTSSTQFKVRFRITGDGTVQYYGWLVDDVKITSEDPYSFSWTSAPAGFTSSVQNPTGVTVNATTDYIVTVTNTNTGCFTTATTTVTVNPLPVITAIAAEDSVCPGLTTTITASGASTYTWTPDASLSGSGATVTVTPTATTTYTVTGTDGNGCINTSMTAVVVNPAVTVTATSTDITCNGLTDGTATAVGAGGTGAINYSWNTTPAQLTATATGLAAGSYTVTATDANGCSATATAVIAEPSAVTVTTTSTDATCNGALDGTATAVGAGGTGTINYSWNTTPAQLTATATGLAAGSYTVTATDANGCSATATAVIAEPSAVTVTTTTTDATCNGALDGTATAVGAGGTGTINYSWSTTPAQLTATATGLGAGSYTVTATDANGCSATASVTITEPAAINLTVSNDTTICAGGTATLIASASASTFTWDNGAGTGSTVNVTPTVNTTYTVTADNGGCTETATINVDVYTGGAVSAGFTYTSSNLTFDFTSTSVNATGLTWDFGDGSPTDNTTNPSHTYASAGNYVVTLIANNPCGADTITESIIITGIEEVAKAAFAVYPNPSKGEFNITYSADNANRIQVTIMSANGQLVMNEEVANFNGSYKRTVNMESYAKGVYMLQITTDKEVVTKRITLN